MVLKMGPLSICVIVSESLSLCELGCLMCRRAGVTGTLHTAVPGVNHEAGCGPKLMLSKGQEQDRWGPLPGRADILGRWGRRYHAPYICIKHMTGVRRQSVPWGTPGVLASWQFLTGSSKR